MNERETILEAGEKKGSLEKVITIPIVQEELQVGIEKKVTGIVRVERLSREHEQVVTQKLRSERISIDRVPVNKYVEETPAVRYEGDTMIVPVMEEIVIVTKQLVLKEEVWIRRHQTESIHEELVKLNSEDVQVSRSSTGQPLPE